METSQVRMKRKKLNIQNRTVKNFTKRSQGITYSFGKPGEEEGAETKYLDSDQEHNAVNHGPGPGGSQTTCRGNTSTRTHGRIWYSNCSEQIGKTWKEVKVKTAPPPLRGTKLRITAELPAGIL